MQPTPSTLEPPPPCQTCTPRASSLVANHEHGLVKIGIIVLTLLQNTHCAYAQFPTMVQ
jgi:hypothetical protein